MRPVGSRPPPAPVSASPPPPRPPRPPGCPRAHWFRDRGGASRSRPPGPAAGSGGAARAGAHLSGGRGTAGPAWRPSVSRGRWPLLWRARALPVSMATSGRRGGECAAPSAGGSPGQPGLGPEGRPLDTQTNAPRADPPATPGSGAQAPPGRTLPPPCRVLRFPLLLGFCSNGREAGSELDSWRARPPGPGSVPPPPRPTQSVVPKAQREGRAPATSKNSERKAAGRRRGRPAARRRAGLCWGAEGALPELCPPGGGRDGGERGKGWGAPDLPLRVLPQLPGPQSLPKHPPGGPVCWDPTVLPPTRALRDHC